MGERATKETWLEGGWARAVTVVGVLFVVWSGEIILSTVGTGTLSLVDVVAALGALIASLGLLASVNRKRLSRAQWQWIGFAYMLLLVAATAVSRHEGEPAVRGWPGGALMVLLYPVMFPATRRFSFAFGVVAIVIDIIAAAAMGRIPTAFAGWVGLYHAHLMATVFAVAIAYLTQRIGQTELTSSSLGSYELLEKLGEGGMGEVWRAKHALLARGAAVKLIHPKRRRDPKSEEAYRRRFDREAQAASGLSSPHTVEVYEYGQREDGVLFFAMELIDGLDMVEVVFRQRPLPPERVAHLLRQVCYSLEEAHDHGLVHRDIKPNNVMVARAGAEHDFVKVLDFGLVKEQESKEDLKLTRDGATPGTPGFMAPEQIMAPSTVDLRADIYGVGCLAYFLVSARLVFESDDWDKVKMSHVSDPVVLPSDRTEMAIHPELEAVIMKCLAKDVKDRYQSARALGDALGAIEFEEPWTRDRARAEWQGHDFKSLDWYQTE